MLVEQERWLTMVITLRSFVPVVVPMVFAAILYGLSMLTKRIRRGSVEKNPLEFAYLGLFGLISILTTQLFVSTAELGLVTSGAEVTHMLGMLLSVICVTTIFFPACIVLPTGNPNHRSQTFTRAAALSSFCMISILFTKILQDRLL